MFDMAAAGLVLSLQSIWIVPLGVTLGMMVGMIPGLTPSNSLAILLPILLALSPELGLIFAISIYVGAECGNSFPAVLLNVPGTPGATVTALEGYPMTVSGRAAEALGVCITASMIGGLVGGILAITSAPALSRFALSFSPVEIAIIVVFGLALIGQFTSGGLLKGLLAGLLGMLIATVGADPTYGQPRGTFGNLNLFDGFSVIAVLVGLLGFSELMMIIRTQADKDAARLRSIGGASGILTGFGYVMRSPVNWLRSSIIGTFIGVMPGAGASVASFIAYQQAATFSARTERAAFGSGARSGLLAADAANNAMVGGSLIPVLTLGLPGSATSAVLLVVMSYHGLAVGPRLFLVDGDVAYSMLWAQFAAALMLLVIGGFIALLTYRISKIPVKALVPVIAVLCLIGGFVRYGAVFDMWTVVAFGVLGYLMKLYSYPVIALLLGFILGPVFEQNLNLALKMGFGTPSAFFTRPMALVLWALLILTFMGPSIVRLLRRIRQTETSKA